MIAQDKTSTSSTSSLSSTNPFKEASAPRVGVVAIDQTIVHNATEEGQSRYFTQIEQVFTEIVQNNQDGPRISKVRKFSIIIIEQT